MQTIHSPSSRRFWAKHNPLDGSGTFQDRAKPTRLPLNLFYHVGVVFQVDKIPTQIRFVCVCVHTPTWTEKSLENRNLFS